MEAIFLKLIEQLNGAVLVLVIVLVLFIWGVWKLSKVVALFGGYQEERKQVKDDLHEINKNIATIEGNVAFIMQKYNASVQTQSPLNLTEKGKKTSTILKIEEKIAGHWDSIKSKINEKSPENPYDIQLVSMDIARDCFNTIFTKDEQDEIKLYAYKQGTNLLEIMSVIGIRIRDRYFKEDNIELDEVDKHDPNTP